MYPSLKTFEDGTFDLDDKTIDSSEHTPIDYTAHEVSVLFSGGSDSTLTASILSERFKHVHLLTYRHAAIRAEDKCLKSVEKLRDAHGHDRFSHQIIDVSALMKKIYLKPLATDLKNYGTYALPMCCGSCRLSMHIATIQYNQKHQIKFAADGSNQELSNLFPEQMKSSLALYRDLYKRFGIRYGNPVFRVNRSDHVLFDRGVTHKRDYKTEHVVYSNQHSCAAGVLLYGYTLGISLPVKGKSSDEAIASKYLAEKIEKYAIPFLEGEA